MEVDISYKVVLKFLVVVKSFCPVYLPNDFSSDRNFAGRHTENSAGQSGKVDFTKCS